MALRCWITIPELLCHKLFRIGRVFAPTGWLSGLVFRLKCAYVGEIFTNVPRSKSRCGLRSCTSANGFGASLCSCMLSPDLNLISSMCFSGKRFLIVTGSRYSQGIGFSKSHWALSWQRDSINAPHEPANEMPGKAKKGKEKNRNHSCNISLNIRARNQRVIKDEQEVRNNTIWRQRKERNAFQKVRQKRKKSALGPMKCWHEMI